jgi:hypothetical protein
MVLMLHPRASFLDKNWAVEICVVLNLLDMKFRPSCSNSHTFFSSRHADWQNYQSECLTGGYFGWNGLLPCSRYLSLPPLWRPQEQWFRNFSDSHFLSLEDSSALVSITMNQEGGKVHSQLAENYIFHLLKLILCPQDHGNSSEET